MVEVPAGTFDMGASDLTDAPVHTVRLAAFKIDETGVTVNAADGARNLAPLGSGPAADCHHAGRARR